MRIFIAIEVEQSAAIYAAELQKCLTEPKLTNPQNLHITLVYIGEVASDAVSKVEQLISDAILQKQAFVYSAENISSFKDGKINYLQCKSDDFFDLRESLTSQLNKIGISYDGGDFCPHITLRRGKKAPFEMPLEKRSFIAQTVVLYQSVSTSEGVVYKPLKKHTLKRLK